MSFVVTSELHLKRECDSLKKMEKQFASIMPANPNLAIEHLIQATRKFIGDSKWNTLSSEEVDISTKRTLKIEGTQISASEYELGQIRGGSIRIDVNNLDLCWRTEISFQNSNGNTQLAISKKDISSKVPRKGTNPKISQYIVDEIPQFQDQGITIQKEPHWVNDMNWEFIGKCLSGNIKTTLPIVYVTNMRNGYKPIISEALARKLSGAAHVFEEDNPRIFNGLKQKLPNAPNQGAIGIIFPEENEFRKITPNWLKRRAEQRISQRNEVYSGTLANRQKEMILSDLINHRSYGIEIPEVLTYDAVKQVQDAIAKK